MSDEDGVLFHVSPMTDPGYVVEYRDPPQYGTAQPWKVWGWWSDEEIADLGEGHLKDAAYSLRSNGNEARVRRIS